MGDLNLFDDIDNKIQAFKEAREDFGTSNCKSELSREDTAGRLFSRKVRDRCSSLNIVMNVICAILGYIFLFSNGHYFLFALSFVLVDFLLTLLDSFVVVFLPILSDKLFNKMSLSKRKKYITKLEKQLQEQEKARDNYCKNCSGAGYNSNCRYSCEVQSGLEVIKELRNKIQEQTKQVQSMEKQLEEEEKNASNKILDVHKEKLEYFKQTKQTLKTFSNKYTIESLVEVVGGLGRLIKALQKKPIGFDLISSKVYIYLNELLTIVTKIETLDEDKKDYYITQLEKLSNSLVTYINSWVERVDKFETQDLDISIDVLIQELNRENNEREEM